MKRKALLLFSILLVISMALSACNSGNEKLQEADSAEIGDYLLRTLKFEDALTKVDKDLMKDLYLVGAKDFDDGSLYVSTYTAEEIAVIKLKDEEVKELDNYKKFFEDRVKIQKSAFEVYRPEELMKLDQALIYCEGNTAILVVSSDKKAAEEAIKNFGKDEE